MNHNISQSDNQSDSTIYEEILILLLKILNNHTFSENDKINISSFLLDRFKDDDDCYYFLCGIDSNEFHLDFIQDIMIGIFNDMIKHIEGYDIIWSEYELALIAYIFDTGGHFYEIPIYNMNNTVCINIWNTISKSFAIPDNYYDTKLVI